MQLNGPEALQNIHPNHESNMVFLIHGSLYTIHWALGSTQWENIVIEGVMPNQWQTGRTMHLDTTLSQLIQISIHEFKGIKFF